MEIVLLLLHYKKDNRCVRKAGGKAELASFQADPSTNQATTGCTVSDPVLPNSVDPDPKFV